MTSFFLYYRALSFVRRQSARKNYVQQFSNRLDTEYFPNDFITKLIILWNFPSSGSSPSMLSTIYILKRRLFANIVRKTGAIVVLGHLRRFGVEILVLYSFFFASKYGTKARRMCLASGCLISTARDSKVLLNPCEWMHGVQVSSDDSLFQQQWKKRQKNKHTMCQGFDSFSLYFSFFIWKNFFLNRIKWYFLYFTTLARTEYIDL